ncbi:MAG: hypothetical protein ACRCVU_13750 [Flavobacterium sp.]
MSSFKEGDVIVACDVLKGSGITKGLVYKVCRLSDDNHLVYIINNNKEIKGYFIWRFTLIDEENE